MNKEHDYITSDTASTKSVRLSSGQATTRHVQGTGCEERQRQAVKGLDKSDEKGEDLGRRLEAVRRNRTGGVWNNIPTSQEGSLDTTTLMAATASDVDRTEGVRATNAATGRATRTGVSATGDRGLASRHDGTCTRRHDGVKGKIRKSKKNDY